MKASLKTVAAAFITAFAVISAPSTLCAEESLREEPALARLFAEYGLKGTFAAFDAKTGKTIVHDSGRAKERFIPASTFKIPNTAIGLEAGAVKSVDEVLPYGGGKQFLPEWEHDMPLRAAIRISAVPIYQELARRVGAEKMRAWVKKLDYGNAEIGEKIDRFWLDGPLKISAVEQTQFLRRLALGELPIQKSTLQAVREITKLEEAEGLTLHGKTGWGMSTDPQVGWWVGWIERDGWLVASFALNADIPDNDAAGNRIPLGRACLTELGLFPKLLTR